MKSELIDKKLDTRGHKKVTGQNPGRTSSASNGVIDYQDINRASAQRKEAIRANNFSIAHIEAERSKIDSFKKPNKSSRILN